MRPPLYPHEARAYSARLRRYSLTRGRAPTNAELLAAAQTLLTLGALLAVVLLILMGIGQ